MNVKWEKLIEQFIEAGYTPWDIQRIVMLYEMTRENDEALKRMMGQEKENANIN